MILDFEHQRQGKDDREFPSFTFPGMSDRFLGNHTHTDYFKLLRQDGDSLVIGARNVIYNISIEGLVENREQVRRRQIQTLRKKKKKKCEEGNERLGKANARARAFERASPRPPIASTLWTEIWQHGTHGWTELGPRNSGNWCQKVELICPDKQRAAFRMDYGLYFAWMNGLHRVRLTNLNQIALTPHRATCLEDRNQGTKWQRSSRFSGPEANCGFDTKIFGFLPDQSRHSFPQDTIHGHYELRAPAVKATY